MTWFNLFTLIWVIFIGFVVFKNRKLALVILIAALPLYLIRLQIAFVPTTWLELGIYSAVIVNLFKAYRQGKFLQWFSPLLQYKTQIIILFFGLIIGVLVSDNQLVSLGILKGWFVDPLLLFLLLINVFSKNYKQGIKYVFGGLWLSAVVLALYAVYQVISGDFITIDSRASSWFTSANYLSLYLAPIIVLGFGLIRSFAKKWLKIVFLLGQILMLIALYNTFSYASWVAVISGGVILLLATKRYWYVLGGLFATVVLLVSQWQMPKFQQMFDFVGRSSSHIRLQVWETAGLMIKENWLTGIGLGQFQDKYVSYAERLFYPPLEFLMLHAHNIFLHFWISAGLLGIIGFIWLLQQWFVNIAKTIKTKPIAIVIIASMTTLLIHGLFDNAYWKNDLSALFWIIIGLGVLIIKQNESKNISDRN